MKVDLNTIIMVFGFVITCYTFVSSRDKNIEQDTKERTKMYTKIDGTCTQINEILRSVDRMTDKFDSVSHTQSRHDEQIKGLVRTLDDHEGRLKELEKNHNG